MNQQMEEVEYPNDNIHHDENDNNDGEISVELHSEEELNVGDINGFNFLSLSINPDSEHRADEPQDSEQQEQERQAQERLSIMLQEEANDVMLNYGIEKSTERDKIQTKTIDKKEVLQYEISASDPVVLEYIDEHRGYLKNMGKEARVRHQQGKLSNGLSKVQPIKTEIERAQARLLDYMKNVMAQRMLLQECKEDLALEKKRKKMLNDIKIQQEQLNNKRKLIETGLIIDSQIDDILEKRNPSRRKVRYQ